MKTAMEMLEEFICLNNYTEIDLVNKIQELLPIEKGQIINAYCSAEDKWEFFESEHRYGRRHLTCEDYYLNTFSTFGDSNFVAKVEEAGI